MKFIISRTSDTNNKKPCKEAKRMEEFIRSDGSKEIIWGIEINDLNELIALQEKYGELILRNTYSTKLKNKQIEIYDWYRE